MADKQRSAASIAYQLGKAHDYLKKVAKIFSELNIAASDEEMELLDLMEFCNSQVIKLSRPAVKSEIIPLER